MRRFYLRKTGSPDTQVIEERSGEGVVWSDRSVVVRFFGGGLWMAEFDDMDAAEKTLESLGLQAIYLDDENGNTMDVDLVKVRVKLSDADLGTEFEHARVQQLEDLLRGLTDEADDMDVDGYEAGEGFATVYVYGNSADVIVQTLLPHILKFKLPAGSFIEMRKDGKVSTMPLGMAVA